MAAIYKKLSKTDKKGRRAEADDEDGDIDDQMGGMDLTDSEDESSEEDEDESATQQQQQQTAAYDKSRPAPPSVKSGFMPKTRVLMLTSRGITSRHRYLLNDISALLPHVHKETKLDTRKKTAGYNFLLNSLAELHSCNVIFFLEAKKRGQDLYLWISRPPNGPTVKFSVTNLHTMGEVSTGFAGNCLKGGRGVVVFDKSFDDASTLDTTAGAKPGTEWRALVREMLRSVFCVPKRGVKRMKPFIDRIIGVYFVDGKIWIRVFEIRETEGSNVNVPGLHEAAQPPKQSKEQQQKQAESETGGKKNKKNQDTKSKHSDEPEISLVEIGPRFVLTPIVILEGSFGGPVIYENKQYVSQNQVRRDIRTKKAARYASRQASTTDRMAKKTDLGLASAGKDSKPKNLLANKAVFS